MEKLQSFLSQRACGCWKQAEKAVRLGPSETREENIILKGVPFIAQPVTGGSETGMRDRRNPIIEVAPRISSSRKLFCVGIFHTVATN